MSYGQTLSNINYAQAVGINGQYFAALSNGGLGHLPNPVSDDSITTDQVVMRREQRPPLEESSKLRFQPTVEGGNPYFAADDNRIKTTGQMLPQLALRGITVMGTDNFGQYNKMIVDPNNMAVYNSYARESESDSTSVILWVLIGIGVITLLGRATSTYIQL